MNKDKALILDACCGGKMFYFDRNDDRVLFQDIRSLETTLCDGRHFEIKPDIQADFTNMTYPDESFSMVVFDPPHLKYTGNSKELKGWQMTKYGHLGCNWKEVASIAKAQTKNIWCASLTVCKNSRATLFPPTAQRSSLPT